MSQQLSLERMVADWMADEAAGGAPETLVDHVLTATIETRPLPRWLAVLREPSMTAQTRQIVGVPRRQLVLAAALVLLAVALVAGAAAFLLRQPPTTDAWPGFRGDASRSGAAVRGPIGNPTIAWQFHADGSVGTAIAVAGGLVLAASDDGLLHAIDIDTGTERWQLAVAGVVRGPFAVDGRVYIASGDGIVHAVALADAARVWDSTTALVTPSEITVLDGHVFVGTGDGFVVTFDAATGRELWRTQVSPDAAPVHGPSARSGVVVAASDDAYLAAIDAATGAVRWRIQASPDLVGTPVIAEGTVYLGVSPDSEGGRLVAVALATGAEQWRIEAPMYAPSVLNGFGYVSGPTGAVRAIDLADGTELWSAALSGSLRPPVVAGEIVYVSLDTARQVVALDRATGGELWRLDVDGGNSCCLAAAGGRLYLGTLAGTVYAIGGDGKILTAGAVPTGGSEPTIEPTPGETSPPSTPVPFPTPELVWAVGTGAAGFIPWGLAEAPDGWLWAAEAMSDRFAIFEADGSFVETWGSTGSGEGEFDMTRGNGDPYGMIAFEPDGSFFVLDVGNRRVQAFDANRAFVGAWGSFGAGPGQFSDPISIAIDAAGNVSVLDQGRRVIETFDRAGTVLRTIEAFPAAVNPRNGANQLAIGRNGHFYVSVVNPNEVIELDPDGNLVREYGSTNNPFADQPNYIAFDGDGRVYVTQGPGRADQPGVVVFDADGTYLGGFGRLGSGEADLGFAWGIVITDSGILTSDAGGLPDVGLTSLIRKFATIDFP